MKKLFFILLLATALMFNFVSCSGKKEKSVSEEPQTKVSPDEFETADKAEPEAAPVTEAAVEENNEGKINLNTADQSLLSTLKGIGPSTANKIIEYRNNNGSFTSVDELTQIRGIGSKTIEKIRDKVYCAGEAVKMEVTSTKSSSSAGGSSGAMVNINTASVSELTTLKGVGPSKAEKIIAYREQNGPFKSVDDIVKVKGIGPKTLAKFRDRLTVE